ncbi:hypothetical protein GCM10007304_27290 [Rhodococcoides trifolii]|uniref:Dimethyladenosine transferase n=1 Tax=Rhodococcoides trifolii TaxID=908250 RepID=A0A917D5R7_9NOCA|nr:SRPBCC family protein [Rhodococcus trifolii]GGG11864.1 hypothetical protein GCM10007304_27290 [Rhodococcus trifolii]
MATVTNVDKGKHAISRRVTVATDANTLFDIVADPHRHSQLDGSGTVKDNVKGPTRLGPGDKFSVGMKQFGVPYKITSTVTEFVDDAERKVLEWQHPMGHRWRWELVQTGPTSTEVTESFLYDTAKSPKILEVLGQTKANSKGITATLEKLSSKYS